MEHLCEILGSNSFKWREALPMSVFWVMRVNQLVGSPSTSKVQKWRNWQMQYETYPTEPPCTILPIQWLVSVLLLLLFLPHISPRKLGPAYSFFRVMTETRYFEDKNKTVPTWQNSIPCSFYPISGAAAMTDGLIGLLIDLID